MGDGEGVGVHSVDSDGTDCVFLAGGVADRAVASSDGFDTMCAILGVGD